MPKISLNDKVIEVSESRLSDAMAAWDYASGKWAVAINGEFVPRSQYDSVTLNEGDEVDIVAPVGGG